LVAIVGFTLLLGSRYVVLFYRNTSGAMEPTLREGDTLVVLIRSRPVAIGDVVVFRYPIRPETVFVQRAIAVGGNIVEIRNKRLSVNGRPVREPYVSHDDATVYPNCQTCDSPEAKNVSG
jgi:signal peptidase I